MKPIIKKTNFRGLWIVEPIIFSDNRGSFFETWHKEDFASVGLDMTFVQTSHSISKKHVLRGIHYQTMDAPMGKLVRCSRGCIFDVAVDLRVKSKTFGNWYGIELNDKNQLQLWIPPGFAHGFLAVSDAHVQYHQTGLYTPQAERTLAWNDPDINIAWSVDRPILSEKDNEGMSLKEYLVSPDFGGEL